MINRFAEFAMTLDFVLTFATSSIALLMGGLGVNLSIHPIQPDQPKRVLQYKVIFCVLSAMMIGGVVLQAWRTDESKRAADKSAASLEQSINALKADLDGERLRNQRLSALQAAARQTIASLIAKGAPLREGACCCGPSAACVAGRSRWEREVEKALVGIDPSYGPRWRSAVTEHEGSPSVALAKELDLLGVLSWELKR